jgi:hypothetical protein
MSETTHEVRGGGQNVASSHDGSDGWGAGSDPRGVRADFATGRLHRNIANVFQCGVNSGAVLFQQGTTNILKTLSVTQLIYDHIWNGIAYVPGHEILNAFTLVFSSAHAGIVQNLISPYFYRRTGHLFRTEVSVFRLFTSR